MWVPILTGIMICFKIANVGAHSANVVLTNQLYDLEHYSRRNCFLFHSIHEEQRESTTAVMQLCNKSLGVMLERNDIDRSHRWVNPKAINHAR